MGIIPSVKPPPPDIDPEKYAVGILDSNVFAAFDRNITPYSDDKVFRLDPALLPIAGLIACNVLFIAVFAVFFWLVNSKGEQQSKFFANAAITFVAIVTCGGFTAMQYFAYRHARQRGPWLIYDKLTGKVTLPRDNLEFELHEIVHLQFVVTKTFPKKGDRTYDYDQAHEFHLVTLRNGERKRWPLFNAGGFPPTRLLDAIVEQTKIPIICIKGDWRGSWEIKETRYVKKQA